MRFGPLPNVHCLLAIVVLLLTSCGSSTTSTPASPTSPAGATGSLKVAILLPGAIDDNSWSQAGYEGLQMIHKELGAQVAFTPSIPVADMEKVFRQYASENVDLLIGHGGSLIPAAEVVAKEFPRIKFAVVAGHPGNNVNLGALNFRNDEGGYLAGTVAGLKTKTNKVAYIGGMQYPHTEERAKFFERGAKAINPSVQVTTVWVGSWDDKDKARQLAEEQIAAGADVLLANTDRASQPVFETAERANVFVIAWSRDQHQLAPKAIVTSVVEHPEVMLLKGARLVQQGRWEAKQYKFGVRDGALKLAPFYGLLTSEQEAKVKAVQEDLLADRINLTP